MKTDKELLELAAKASEINLGDEIDSYIPGSRAMWIVGRGGRDAIWNPLNDDGDALRLAVKLQIDLEWQSNGGIEAYHRTDISHHCAAEEGSDMAFATRRAIVRAAAAIGEQL